MVRVRFFVTLNFQLYWKTSTYTLLYMTHSKSYVHEIADAYIPISTFQMNVQYYNNEIRL